MVTTTGRVDHLHGTKVVVSMSRDPLSIRLRWLVVGWLETQLQTVITRRILAYHDRLVRDGFIPDLRPPYPGRSSAGATASPDRAVPRDEPESRAEREYKASPLHIPTQPLSTDS